MILLRKWTIKSMISTFVLCPCTCVFIKFFVQFLGGMFTVLIVFGAVGKIFDFYFECILSIAGEIFNFFQRIFGAAGENFEYFSHLNRKNVLNLTQISDLRQISYQHFRIHTRKFLSPRFRTRKFPTNWSKKHWCIRRSAASTPGRE